MAYADPQLLHLDSMLTQVSVEVKNDELVGDLLFPSVSVDKQSDKYYVQESKVGFTPIDDIRAPNAATNEMPPMSISRDSYFAEEHALKDWVSIEEEKNADNPLTPLADAAARVSDTILLNRENAIMTMVTTLANYASGHSTTLVGNDQWSAYSTSNPITDLKTGRDKIHLATFKYPTLCAMGYEVSTQLEDHPDFLDRIKSSPLAMTTLETIGQLVGIPRLVRAGAGKNTAALGAAESVSYLWGKNVVMGFIPAGPSVKTPAFGYEYNWRFEGAEMPTDRWFDTDRKATAVRVSRRYDLKFAAVDTVASGKATGGYAIAAAIA